MRISRFNFSINFVAISGSKYSQNIFPFQLKYFQNSVPLLKNLVIETNSKPVKDTIAQTNIFSSWSVLFFDGNQVFHSRNHCCSMATHERVPSTTPHWAPNRGIKQAKEKQTSFWYESRFNVRRLYLYYDIIHSKNMTGKQEEAGREKVYAIHRVFKRQQEKQARVIPFNSKAAEKTFFPRVMPPTFSFSRRLLLNARAGDERLSPKLNSSYSNECLNKSSNP